MKPRTFTLRNDTWGFEVAVRIGGTVSEADRWATRLTGESCSETNPGAGGFVFAADGGKHCVMWLSRPLHPDVIAHEALHVVNHMMSVSGMGRLSGNTEEAYCYLLGWLVREIWRRR